MEPLNHVVLARKSQRKQSNVRADIIHIKSQYKKEIFEEKVKHFLLGSEP